VLALALILVHFKALAVVAVVVVPPAVWLLSRSYGGLVLGLVVILVAPSWQTFGTAQLSLLRLASIAAAVTLLVTRRFRLHQIDLALLFFVVVLVAGWLLQYDQPHAGRVLSQELTPLGFYLGARALPSRWIRLALLTILLAGTVGALTVVYEYIHGSAIFLDPTMYKWNATSQSLFRPGGVYGGPSGASAVLCFVIIFGLACLTFVRGRTRLWAAMCVAVSGVALLVTFTRAAMIGVAVGALLFLWLIRSPILRPLRVAWAAVGIAALLVVVVPTLQTSTTFNQGVLRAGTLSAREGYWSDALPVATSSPHNLLLGIGTSALETPSPTDNALVRGDVAIVPLLVTNSLHSEYVTVLVEQGLLGLAALILLLAAAVAPLARRARRTRDAVPAALAASIVAFAIVMSVDTLLLSAPCFAMFMLALGLGANVMCSSAGPASDEFVSRVSSRPIRGTSTPATSR
jgi:O-antigen ligase